MRFRLAIRIIVAGSLVLAGCVRAGFFPRSDGSGDRPFTPIDGLDGVSARSEARIGDVSKLKVPGTWVLLGKGTFVMGSPASETCRYPNETQHSVTLTRSFEITTTEVTQTDFQATMGYADFYFPTCGASCPAENVSWHEAAAYCNKLSSILDLASCYSCSGTGDQVTCSVTPAYSAGKIYSCPGFRLPTEAEWEYAYRAGTTSLHYAGTVLSGGCNSCSVASGELDKIAWYCANGSKQTHPTGNKAANAWGLFDMAGNVAEWAHDGYLATLGTSSATDPWGNDASADRTVRGGSFPDYSQALRAAGRLAGNPMSWNQNVGFRCVRTR